MPVSLSSEILTGLDRSGVEPKAKLSGIIKSFDGLVVRCDGFPASVGSLCKLEETGGASCYAEVIGFKNGENYIVPYSHQGGIVAGSRIELIEQGGEISLSEAFLGRVINGLCEPIDGLGPLPIGEKFSLNGTEINPLTRRKIGDVFDTGVRAVNGLLSIGQGQRVGIIAGSGVGKSVLLSMITRHSDVDVIIVGLIGERSREIGDFIRNTFTDENQKKLCVVAESAEKAPLRRIRAANIAASLAEYFRMKGKNVLLIMDSLTRVAHARREIGLALGEAGTLRGYPSSALSLIPSLIERAGQGDNQNPGSITGVYTILADGDDQNDPVVDTARAILDGHILLARSQAQLGIYPAIDVSTSISRVMGDLIDEKQLGAAEKFKRLYSIYNENRDLMVMGGYVRGSDPELDQAIDIKSKIDDYLKQKPDESVNFEDSKKALSALMG